MYLLDTDVVSNFRKPKPHPNLLTWLQAVKPEEIWISAMTVFEIQVGASFLGLTDTKRAEELEGWLDGITRIGGLRVLPVDVDVARLYARMFATPSLKNFLLPDPRSKRPKSGVDLIIAATAIVHDATIVTVNGKDYLRVHEQYPIPSIYDPFASAWLVGGAIDKSDM